MVEVAGHTVTITKAFWSTEDIEKALCNDITYDGGSVMSADLRVVCREALLSFLTNCCNKFMTSPIYAEHRRVVFPKIKEEYKKQHDYFIQNYYPRLGYKRDLYAHQKDVLATVMYRKRNLLALEQGLGKALFINELLFTPSGFIKMKDVKIGETLYGSNGKPCTVIGVFPQGKLQMYKVTFSDNTSVECCEDHLWKVTNKDMKYLNQGYKVMSLKEILDYGITKSGRTYWRIPKVEPIEIPAAKQNIDAYTLGLLLGDGCFRSSISFSTIDHEELIPVLEENLKGMKILKNKGNNYSWSITPIKRGYNGDIGVNWLINELKNLGLFNTNSHTKFVPKNYLIASKEQRLSILQGMLDTDGHVNKLGNRVSITTVSPLLAEDIKFLTQSLGGTVNIKTSVREGKRDCFYMSIILPNDIVPFRLKRRVERLSKKQVLKQRTIISVEKTTVEEAQCISVNSPDKTFLTTDLIVTHNTITSASISKMFQVPRTIIVCPSIVKWNWFRDMTDDWGYNKLYWSILDAKPSRTVIAFSERFVVVNYEMVNKYFNRLTSADCGHIIFDECQKIKNSKTAVFKSAYKLTQMYPKARITLLSGTPVTNRVNDMFAYFKITGHPLGNDYKKFISDYTISGVKGAVSGSKNIDELKKNITNFMVRKRTVDCVDLPELIINNYVFKMEDHREEYMRILGEMAGHVEEYESEQDAGKKAKLRVGVKANLVSLNRLVATSKVKSIIELAENLIELGRKVVIFSSFTSPLLLLQEHFKKKCVLINGATDSQDRDKYIQQFKNDPDTMVFLGNVKAAGVGINLVNANDVIFTNFPFTPDDLEQPYKRLHRIGQKNNVNVYYTICEDTIDTNIYDIIVSKTRDINNLIDDNKDGVVHYDQIETRLFKELVEHYKRTNPTLKAEPLT